MVRDLIMLIIKVIMRNSILKKFLEDKSFEFDDIRCDSNDEEFDPERVFGDGEGFHYIGSNNNDNNYEKFNRMHFHCVKVSAIIVILQANTEWLLRESVILDQDTKRNSFSLPCVKI